MLKIFVVDMCLLKPCTCVSSIFHPFIRCLRESPAQFNTLTLRENGRHFPDDVFRCIFLNENCYIAIQISLKFVSAGPINNMPPLVLIMAWHQTDDKPLSEPMMVSLLMHICLNELITPIGGIVAYNSFHFFHSNLWICDYQIRYQREIDKLQKENRELKKSLLLKDNKNGKKRKMKVGDLWKRKRMGTNYLFGTKDMSASVEGLHLFRLFELALLKQA